METDWSKHWRDNHGSRFWRTWTRRITRAYTKLLRDVAVDNPRILELGSGSGVNSLVIAATLKAKEITLVDFNAEALEISKRLFEKSACRVTYLKEDILKLTLSKQFDVVHSEGLIEHFYDNNRLAVFKKHTDLCKAGGYIILFVPYESLQYSLFKWTCTRLNKWIWQEKPFTRRELYELCERLDLPVLKEYTSPFMHEIGILIKKPD